ncbi:DUF7724 family protein [Blautia sp.]|uniref:DUF7724 family protein n=1 Tax=Blautia sp. TaxID=1955243 RepID=UPI003FA4C3B2
MIISITIFIFRNQVIRFVTSSKLEKYTSIKEWDHGYLVVTIVVQLSRQKSKLFIMN